MGVRFPAILFIIGVTVTCVGLFLGLYLFPKLLNDKIDESLKIVNNTEAYNRWKKLPTPIKYKIYLFNITNAKDVRQGAKPILQQTGPYVYDEYREKFNITEKEDTISYYENYIYKFNVEDSKPNTENDYLTIVNLPLMSIITAVAKDAPEKLEFINNILPDLFKNNTDLFLKTTPKEFFSDGISLYCDKNQIINMVCREIERKAPAALKPLYEKKILKGFKFSLLTHKNNTHKGLFTINTGKTDISELGKIISWKNSTTLDIWNVDNGTNPQCGCNNICGTDSTLFPPHRNPNTPLISFGADICRTVILYYERDVTYSDISAYRYVIDRKFFNSPQNNSDNNCLCLNKTARLNGNECLLDGAMDLLECEGAPLVLSFPHFFLGHELYQQGVEGLNPSQELHNIYVDIEPSTGSVLRGNKRVQVNIFYRNITNIKLTENLTTTLMPVFWVDEGGTIPAKITDKLQEKLFKVQRFFNYIYWGTTAFGGLAVIISVFWYFLLTNK